MHTAWARLRSIIWLEAKGSAPACPHCAGSLTPYPSAAETPLVRLPLDVRLLPPWGMHGQGNQRHILCCYSMPDCVLRVLPVCVIIALCGQASSCSLAGCHRDAGSIYVLSQLSLCVLPPAPAGREGPEKAAARVVTVCLYLTLAGQGGGEGCC